MEEKENVIALDLGSTRFKAGSMSDGQLTGLQAVPALETHGEDPIFEHHAEELLPKLQELLHPYSHYTLGLSVQRSTCVFWDQEDGRPLTPMVSWRDRRARDWCDAHSQLGPALWELAGLPLSPHYAGPTAAVLMNEAIRKQLQSGRALFGTVDTFALWLLSGGRHYVTDLTVASRTLLVDLRAGAWGGPLLDLIGIPRSSLPEIVSSRCDLALGDGNRVGSMLGDQAAAVTATVALDGSEILVNVGTGTFVLYPEGESLNRAPGCLCVPVLSEGGRVIYAMEGPVNSPVDASITIPDDDPNPDLFCLPDSYGLGAPYWQGDGYRRFSSIQGSPLAVAEGVIFRVRQLIHLMAPDSGVRVVVSGGGAAESWVKGLASCLQRPVYRAYEGDASLLGAGRVAEGSWESCEHLREEVLPSSCGAYLAEKYERWYHWLDSLSLACTE